MSTVVRPPEAGSPQLPPPRRRRWPWAAAAGAVVVILIAGAAIALSGGGEDDELRLPPPVAPQAPQTEEERLAETYTEAVEAGFQAMAVPDPDHPLLFAYLVNPQLDKMRSTIRGYQEKGVAIRQPPNSKSDRRVTVLSVEGDRARLSECLIDDGYPVRISDGQSVGFTPSGDVVAAPPNGIRTFLFASEMVREPGGWKLSSARTEQKWEGVTGCWVGQ